MNSVVRQLWEQNTDIVMVDTGNSYEGLCEYVGGKLHRLYGGQAHHHEPLQHQQAGAEHREDRLPEEPDSADMEGSEVQIPELEFRVVEQLVTEYYDFYFNGVQPILPHRRRH